MKKLKSYNLFLESSNLYGIHDWIEETYIFNET